MEDGCKGMASAGSATDIAVRQQDSELCPTEMTIDMARTPWLPSSLEIEPSSIPLGQPRAMSRYLTRLGLGSTLKVCSRTGLEAWWPDIAHQLSA
jgi:hypothetical protein